MNKQKTIIYHIIDSRNLPIIVQPFGEQRTLSGLPDAERIEGRYGSDPEVEAMAMIRNLLYNQIDREVKEWLAEKRFLPRFALAVAVFFLSFFFTAFVIRDVIPLLDEMLLSTAAAVTAYIIVERKGQISKPALEKKILLKKRVDRINFTASDMLLIFERLFRLLDSAWTSGSGNLEGGGDTASGVRELADNLAVILKDPESRGELEGLAAGMDIPGRKKRRIRKNLSEGRVGLGRNSREERLFALTEAILRGHPLERLFPAADQRSQPQDSPSSS
jgi:hypothetical protein